MITLRQTLLLFLVIVIEGYVVLSSELIAIRQTIPFVGSGTDTISIIIAAVLMPLAFGYHFGGQFKPKSYFGYHISIRKKLILNILIASIILLIGMSYGTLWVFFVWLLDLGINNRLALTATYSVFFLAIPVYLLGQTIPLVSNYFSKERLSRITGKMLFFSTIGSFAGAVLSTTVLMAFFGVHHTVSLNFILLAILVITISKKKTSYAVYLSLFVAVMGLLLNSNAGIKSVHGNGFKIRSNNQYATLITQEIGSGDRLLFINNNTSSLYSPDGKKYPYIEFAERIAIYPILNASPPKKILVIGAGGFTFGHNDTNNIYTYVDINKDLKNVAETHILEEPIGKNKTFISKPARAFLTETNTKYDVIYLDAYLGGGSIPEHLVTYEFFQQVKARMKSGSILISNMILTGGMDDAFSKNIDNTFRAVFPHVSRHAVNEAYNLWEKDGNATLTNIAYIYRHSNLSTGHIYTDNKNSVFWDKHEIGKSRK